jgi:hypothetical protein
MAMMVHADDLYGTVNGQTVSYYHNVIKIKPFHYIWGGETYLQNDNILAVQKEDLLWWVKLARCTKLFLSELAVHLQTNLIHWDFGHLRSDH